jgi:heparosan-N-sulfate-glucuronate 5-epimerase
MHGLSYLRRVFQAYFGAGASQLSFWHERPTLNEKAFDKVGNQYYMTFRQKAAYAGPADEQGIPLLDYRGALGKQYNPIAIAQYGLGCFNRFKDTGDPVWAGRMATVAKWLVTHLEVNAGGCSVWMHHFDWEYFRILKGPWYSGLAQGQGISLLLRAFEVTGDASFLQAATQAFHALTVPIAEGGTLLIDQQGDWWIEEYITEPATHILNGFMWALWGVYDYRKSTGSDQADELWRRSVETLSKHMAQFDCGFWSTYDLAPTWARNPASPFYHQLHLVQLEVMYRLTGQEVFLRTLTRWRRYNDSIFCRNRAYFQKCLFKLVYY